MEVVEKRFENFIQFISDKAKDNILVSSFLNTINFQMFIITLKDNIKNDNTPDDIIDKIFNKINVKREDFEEDDITKLYLYINYFIEISNIL